MTTEGPKYEMTLSLNVLRHLGLGLYSNVAAVLSEVVANSWDADARQVCISIDAENGMVTIQDDGHGMTVEDANQKYLFVGHERRKDASQVNENGRTLCHDRRVMGRKGIGKLSLFSIARTVEVHSIKSGEKHGFIMDSDEIEEQIGSGPEAQYFPRPVNPKDIILEGGTRIILRNMKRRLQWTGKPLRRRLARRFSVIGPQNKFEIRLDGKPVTVSDRDYQDKIQYIWTFGDMGLQIRDSASNLEKSEPRSAEVKRRSDFKIDGWIGTVKHSGNLVDSDTKESINKIVIMVRGKLAQEDILEEFGEGGLYTKYIFGEIHADFLDLDEEEDIATTSRQKLIEEDPRYQALKTKLRQELKHVQSKWTEWRKEQAKEQVIELLPQIMEWFESLDHDQRKAAERLFGNLNQVPIDSEKQRRQLFISGVLTFESLKFRKLLHRLDEVSPENLVVLNQIFIQLDDLEASAYWQIAKDRVVVIRRLMDLVDENAKEEALQKHIYTHLWLLDPSWERATNTLLMERRIATALDAVSELLPKEQRYDRLDIKYTTTANKHVIIELKRADRVLSTAELFEQLTKYSNAAKSILANTGRNNEPLEIVCVLGKRPREWRQYPESEQPFRESLRPYNARIVSYDQFIDNALQAYQEFVDREQDAGRVYKLIQEISEEDVEALSPSADQH